ncbi:hypothetical protein BC937DRAFT_89795 [Endogone sp. FLAS-F59071]|nr:hypothetical protein BC937DRAFT_89795 [Endogone sp. FLAS-F59071]|eukprot:RUS22283.1 hypothetical protein BC937DRAFT_89795 [Endogone sp. FLAS-F59071]
MTRITVFHLLVIALVLLAPIGKAFPLVKRGTPVIDPKRVGINVYCGVFSQVCSNSCDSIGDAAVRKDCTVLNANTVAKAKPDCYCGNRKLNLTTKINANLLNNGHYRLIKEGGGDFCQSFSYICNIGCRQYDNGRGTAITSSCAKPSERDPSKTEPKCVCASSGGVLKEDFTAKYSTVSIV